MIAKRIMAPKASNSFQRLGAYVLNVKDGQRASDPRSWSRLNAYILDTKNDGEKVAWARATNCVSDDLGWAVKEIIATQAQNTRSESSKNYHLVVSFPEGERPDREQLEDIEDRLCEAIGLDEHQRVSAVHQNTDNWHLHIAINTVHPKTMRNGAPYQDHFRLQETCAELEIKHELVHDNHADPLRSRGARGTSSGAQAFDAHQAVPSFLTWVRKEAAADLVAARDSGKGWQALHEAATSHGLVLKLRGAGLVVGHTQNSRLHIKASDVDRGLSLKALTDQLGSFEPTGHTASTKPAISSYNDPTKSGQLYEAFKQERDAAENARKAAQEALRARHLNFGRELNEFYRDRMQREKQSGLHGVLRRESFQHIATERTRDHAARKDREAAERVQARIAHPVPAWQQWLEAKAADGNVDALTMLRSRQQRATRLEADLVDAGDPASVKHVIKKHLRPLVRRNGTVIYNIADGGMVADEVTHVRVAQQSHAATLLAVALATERFGAKPLVVRGTEVFRNQVAVIAGKTGAKVTFADPQLEDLRQQSTKDRSAFGGKDIHVKARHNRSAELSR